MKDILLSYKKKLQALFLPKNLEGLSRINPLTMSSVYATCRRTLVYVAIFSFIMNAITLAVPIYTLQIFDRVLQSHMFDTLIFMTLLVVVFLSVYGVLSILRSWILLEVSDWMGRVLSQDLLENSIEGKQKGAPYTTESLKDMNAIRQFFQSQGILALYDSPWIFIFLLVMLWFNVILGIVGIVAAIILYGIAYFNEKSSALPIKIMHQESLIHEALTRQVINNASSLLAMGMAGQLLSRWKTQLSRAALIQRQMFKRSTVFNGVVKTSRMIIQVLIIAIGAALVVNRSIAPGAMIAASILISRALAPIELAVGSSKQLTEAWQAFYRLREYLIRPHKRLGSVALSEPKGKVNVEQVTFAFPNTTQAVLHQISFALNPGELLVVMGPNGAGKSTLAELLLGVYRPNSGTLRLDGADIYLWPRDNIGQHVGYLSQSIDLFSGTVKENIARMEVNVDSEKVIKAAQDAHIHDEILHFPEGYDSLLAEEGKNYSMGQRQKIALARAFYGEPKMIVLDEPTAHLDTEGVQSLIQALQGAKQKKQTVIVISHHPVLTNFADKLLLLQKGQIHMFGPRQAVVEKLQELQSGVKKS